MLDTRHAICRLAERLAEEEDPKAALGAVRALRAELDEFERSVVAAALEGGSSFGDVARQLGISRQAAHRRYRDLVPSDPRPVLSAHAIRALQLAQEEARALGASALSSEHLLIGVLRGGGDTCRALEAEGITRDGVRECVRAGGGGEGEACGRAALNAAATIAAARGAPCIDPDHIVLAALAAGDGGALRAITALGVKPAAVRARLGC